MKGVDEVISRYPGLVYDDDSGRLAGFIDIGYGDRYHLEIDIRIFPKFFPTVLETRERIPRTSDRHCYFEDGSLCFTTPPIEEILLKTRIRRLSDFFDEILVPFLTNNSYFEINGEYKFETFAHGKILSLLQTYKKLLLLDDAQTVLSTLRSLESGRKYLPNEPCFCGSGRKIKKCGGHLGSYQQTRLLSRTTLAQAVQSLIEYVEKGALLTASGQVTR